MAINKTIGCGVSILGDGTSTTFTVDLERDPWSIYPAGVGSPASPADVVQNFFLEDTRSNAPIGVSSVISPFGGSYPISSASLSSGVLTVVFGTAPLNGASGILPFTLLF